VPEEERSVEGKNMDFHADVYGTLISRGGTVRIARALSGGKASSPDGEIIVEGRASSSALEAPRGKIRLAYAEVTTCFGKRAWRTRSTFRARGARPRCTRCDRCAR
jgi:hypothetical protein